MRYNFFSTNVLFCYNIFLLYLFLLLSVFDHLMGLALKGLGKLARIESERSTISDDSCS